MSTEQFASLLGENWVVGRYLLPRLNQIGSAQRGVVLDLGCGGSPFRDYFRACERYVRVDRMPLDADVIAGDMLAIPLPAESVDAVLLFQAISDVPSPGRALAEVRRVLRPGGRLFLFETMAYPEHDSPSDFFRVMPEGLRHLAEEAGLKLESCERLGGLFTRFASLWNWYVMGKLKQSALLRPLGHVGVVAANLALFGMDRLWPYPRLASDYLAVLALGAQPSSPN